MVEELKNAKIQFDEVKFSKESGENELLEVRGKIIEIQARLESKDSALDDLNEKFQEVEIEISLKTKELEEKNSEVLEFANRLEEMVNQGRYTIFTDNFFSSILFSLFFAIKLQRRKTLKLEDRLFFKLYENRIPQIKEMNGKENFII